MFLMIIVKLLVCLNFISFFFCIMVVEGDGVGKEIMQVILDILNVVGVRLIYDKIKIGKEVYLDGYILGISLEVWDKLCENKVFLKGFIIIFQGGGYKSLNVIICKSFGLYVNVCFCCVNFFYVYSYFFNMDLVVIWENEEDFYVGIEYQ